MPILSLKDVHKAYGPQVLLDGVSLTVRRSARIGLIGRNGEGKSTLLKIMAGIEHADSGEVTPRRGARIGYLSQLPWFTPGQTVFAAVSEGLGAQVTALRAYDTALVDAASDASAENMARLAVLQEELEHSGGWLFRTRIETAISRLGLDAHSDAGALSGGWQRRVALARVLVAAPDVLLLDEPTNHLDLDAISWLEDFIADFPGAVVFVTHDRYFLDAMAEEIVELDRGHLRHYDCTYAQYLDKKAGQLAVEARRLRKFDRLLAAEERWIRRGIPARRSRDEGRVRRLEGLRAERQARRLRGGDVSLRVACGIKPGRMLIEAAGLSHAFGSRMIVRNLDLKIMAGERIGLVGPNGVGKTTLLRLLLGEIRPDAGKIRHGARLVPAFLEQMRALDEDKTLREVLLPQGGQYVYVAGVHARHVVGYLEDFLFDREKLRARVAALSGGERGRLLLEPANLLVLDEPTNDLDLGTLTVLEQALAKYDGTILLVSHDRAFMDRVVSRVLAFEGGGVIVPITGGYSDYAVWKSKQKAVVAAPPRTGRKTVRSRRTGGKLSYKDQRELDSLPGAIECMEAEKSGIEERFCDPAYFQRDASGFREDEQRLKVLERELHAAYARWEELEARRESGAH